MLVLKLNLCKEQEKMHYMYQNNNFKKYLNYSYSIFNCY